MTAVELLPVFQFDEQDAPRGPRQLLGVLAGLVLCAASGATAPARILWAALDEFRDMVKALHRAGIEVILDVVFNHTAEGNHAGPTLCFRGLDNTAYYMLEDDRSRYANYTGTGNTLNANQPIVRRMIVDSLRYWVEEMHVDGFRFDLASILSRDERAARWRIRPFSGTSNRIRCWPGRSSSPKPGMRPGCIRWARSSGTAGRNGTASSGMTCAAS